MTVVTAGTPSQTAGPFFRLGTDPLLKTDLTGPGISGDVISIEGRVLDGAGEPVPDALVETWQADAAGHFPTASGASGGFRGFARLPTDERGRFRLRTVRPGRVPGPGGGLQAAHLAVTIFMRGLLKHLVTRVYFGGDPALDSDPILKSVDRARRGTLIAASLPSTPGAFVWDVHLQGPAETVFFDI